MQQNLSQTRTMSYIANNCSPNDSITDFVRVHFSLKSFLSFSSSFSIVFLDQVLRGSTIPKLSKLEITKWYISRILLTSP